MPPTERYNIRVPQSSPDRFKKTYLALAFICLIVILAISIYVIQRQSYNNFIAYTENNSEKIVDAICYTEVEAIHINETITVPTSSFDYLDAKIRDTYDALDVLSLTIYDKNKTIIYSNNNQTIGTTVNDGNLQKIFSSDGVILSNLVTHVTIVDLHGEKRENIDVLNVYIPVKNTNGNVIGAFSVAANATKLKSQYKNQLSSSIVILVSAILLMSLVSFVVIVHETNELKCAYQLLESFANTDILTGLFNRSYYELEMERLSLSRRYPVGIITIDLDNLKALNDTYGHPAGDKMICKASEILKKSFRTDDLVARIGGDEFAIILPETDADGVQNAIERITAVLAEANSQQDGFEVKFSLGSAVAETKEKLYGAVKEADKKMYQNKATHKFSM